MESKIFSTSWAVVLDILHPINAEWDQATSQEAAKTRQAPAKNPREQTWFVINRCRDNYVTARARYLLRVVSKFLGHVNRLWRGLIVDKSAALVVFHS